MRRPDEAPLSIGRSEPPVEGVVVLDVEGDLVLTSCAALISAVRTELADGARRVVIDLSRTTHVDMPGFARLVELDAACREGGTEILVAALPDEFRDVCDALRLDQALTMVDDVEAALEAIR